MFGPRIQQYARRIAEMIVQATSEAGHDTEHGHVIGLLLNCITATVLALGYLRLGGLLLLFAGMFDMVDGALARVRNQKTIFGAFFDSTLDRYSEGIISSASSSCNTTASASVTYVDNRAGICGRARLVDGQLCACASRRPRSGNEERTDGPSRARTAVGCWPPHRRRGVASLDVADSGGDQCVHLGATHHSRLAGAAQDRCNREHQRFTGAPRRRYSQGSQQWE